jgi:hypothetical protein
MGGVKRTDPTVLLLAAGALLSSFVVVRVERWLAAGAVLARSPLVAVLAGVALIGLVALLLARELVVRRALGARVRFLLLPADAFDPTPESVLRFAAGLARVRRPLAGWLEAPASAVRVGLDTDEQGRLRYTLELPARAAAALRTAASAYHAVELRQIEPPVPTRRAHTARVELVLARSSVEPLRMIGLDPDPLAAFARALGSLRHELGEEGAVHLDVLPIASGARRRLRRRLLRTARREHHTLGAAPGVASVLSTGGPRGRAAPAELVERRTEQRALSAKLGSCEPLFAIQVLLHTHAATTGRAKLTLGALQAAFDAFAGENHFRAGRRRGRRLERRVQTGRFAPRQQQLVTASEIAGLLKPPTAKCPAANVLRSGGVIPPPPRGLPGFRGQRELLPLGRITTETEQRMVGVPLKDTFFSYMAGRSRYGKTETALGQFVHLARSGHGCFLLDPHEDAIQRAKHYLAHADLRERVIEVNLAAGPDRQPGWNLFAAHGRQDEQVIDAVVDAFASTLRWDETNTRALNLTTQAAQALIQLTRRLPVELAPTVFQIPTLLGNEDWRAAVLAHLSPATRQFFTDRFPRLSAEAITPVTNLIDRLRVSPALAALLGSPTSSYDVRRAMDRGQIVLACPGSGSGRDRLIANFLVYDLLHAAKTRAALAPERRRPFYVFLDEVQTYDGATSGTLAALLEQSAKYGVRAFLFNQNPERLTPATLNAITTNRSHLATTALNAKAAALLAREWGTAIEPEIVTRLARYSYLTSVTLAGETSPPFLVHGAPLEELYPDRATTEELAALEAAIDQRLQRRPITETLTAVENHDQRIIEHLHRTSRPSMVAGPRTIKPHGP